MLKNYSNKNMFFIILCILNLILFFRLIYKYNTVIEGWWSRGGDYASNGTTMIFCSYWNSACRNKRESDRKAAEAAAAAEKIKLDQQTQILAVQPYTLSPGSSKTCGFYFKTNTFDSLYSNNSTNQYIESGILNNSYNYCFNVDANNTLYSIINIDAKSYTLKDTNYQVKFYVKKKGDFIDCFSDFINNCNAISSINYEVDSALKTITIPLANNKCIINLKTYNNVSDVSTIASNVTSSNVEKVTYLKTVDLTKKYTYGQLYYTESSYYDCIVMNA